MTDPRTPTPEDFERARQARATLSAAIREYAYAMVAQRERAPGASARFEKATQEVEGFLEAYVLSRMQAAERKVEELERDKGLLLRQLENRQP